MVKRTYPGDDVAKRILFKDKDDNLFDPVTVNLLVIDATGVTQETKAIGDLEKLATGTYKLTFSIAAEDPTGKWKISITATDSTGFKDKEIFTFSVDRETRT